MKSIILCGHTGSANRGCEAIVRSSCSLLRRYCPDAQIILATHNRREDEYAGLSAVVDGFVEYTPLKGMSCKRIKYAFYGKVLRDQTRAQRVAQEKVWELISSDTLLLNIGGDTYCYQRPVISYELNKTAQEKGARSVLFGCSVSSEVIDEEMLDDLRRYSLIIARERDTYDNLLQAGVDEERLRLYPDPAFCLEAYRAGYKALPENSVGINLSPIVMDTGGDGTVLASFDALIKHILDATDMNVLLVPHVYCEENVQDLIPLGELFYKYARTGRVRIVSEELDCRVLKGIIADCRFFVGARTHSVIAAYSSCVPALAVSYSMKASGIARDIFGTDEGGVLSGGSVTPESLIGSFEDMRCGEDKVRAYLRSFMPAYIARTESLGREISEVYYNGTK